MKNIKYLLLFSLFALSCKQPPSDCSQFRTGTYQNVEKGVVLCVIERQETTQIERCGDYEVTLGVEWLDACTYKLSYQDANDKYKRDRLGDLPLKDMTVRIVELHDTYYEQETTIEGREDEVYRSEMRRVE